jgi:hypothetical protein
MALRLVFHILLFYSVLSATAPTNRATADVPLLSSLQSSDRVESMPLHGLHPLHAPALLGEETVESEEFTEAQTEADSPTAGLFHWGFFEEEFRFVGPQRFQKTFLVFRNLRI